MNRYFCPLLILIVVLFLWTGELYAQEKAVSFSLPKLGTEQPVGLDDFKGSIVVLDFFSAGCPKCYRASWEIESGIQEYYESRSGNPHSIPVRVAAVSSEEALPDDMQVFLEDTELSLVLNDEKGTLLKQYGAAALPYIVVIDAAGKNASEPVVVSAFEEYDGIDKLREVIDKITGRAESYTETAVTDLKKHIINEALFDTSAIIASDVYISDTVLEYKQKKEATEYSVALSYRRIDMDYSSQYLDVIRNESLKENWFSVNGSVKFNLNPAVSLSLDGGFYDGYQTYRAVWLDNYYRHVYGVLKTFIDGIEGYEKAEPWGYSISGGLKWEYLPGAGFAEAGVSYQRDVVSPGYEMGVTVVKLEDAFNTVGFHISTENILTRRMRSLIELGVSDTTERDPRYTLQASLNYAPADHWVTRFNVAGAKERPNFRAKSVSLTLERDWREKWFVSIFGRYYEDTSEIENSVSSSAAAPPLKTYQAGLGLRMQGIKTSFKFTAGPCNTKYDRLPDRDTAFDQLYKDRDWFSVQIVFLHKF